MSKDFSFTNHGSITILMALSPSAKIWIEDHVQVNEETQFWGGGVVIEPRYAGPILQGIVADGLTV